MQSPADLILYTALALGAGLFRWALHTNWHWRASQARAHAGVRRMTLPIEVDEAPLVPLGYRDTRARAEPRPALPLVFDRSRSRPPNMRILRNAAHIAVKVDLTVLHAIVRIEAMRDGDEAVVRAYELVPLDAAAEWARRAREVLDPMMDDLLAELCGRDPIARAPARAAGNTTKPAIERRGWPKP